MHSTRGHITAPEVRGQGEVTPVKDATDRSRHAGEVLREALSPCNRSV